MTHSIYRTQAPRGIKPEKINNPPIVLLLGVILRAFLVLFLLILMSGCLGKATDGKERAAETQDFQTRKEEVTSEIPPAIARLKNPVPAANASIEAGWEAYDKFCSFCHGESGTGEAAFKTEGEGAIKPADLRKWQDLNDGELFSIITNGVNDTEMLPWGEILTPRQRWDIINYLRTFKEQE